MPGEFACKHCGAHGMNMATLDRLQALRTEWGAPMHINSGYRCPQHPIEAAKPDPGGHAKGRAIDVAMLPVRRNAFIALAQRHGFTGIGVAKTYVHIDDIQSSEFGKRRPARWVYP
jgi:uncharacterized protein YcbK (DUF882 family)